tara:strand:+ start:657 stop:899 length:243 start_codon:yes stop_codon:yes gene_type:complete
MKNALKTVRPLKKFANRFSVEGFNAGRPVHVIENTDASGTEINVIYQRADGSWRTAPKNGTLQAAIEGMWFRKQGVMITG